MAENTLVLTPGGYRDRSLVHHVPPGHVLDFADGRTAIRNLKTDIATEVPPSKAKGPTLEQGWIASACWVNDTQSPLTQFCSGWQVPKPPTAQDDQVIYLFNGLQPPGGYAILQPVLQWGVSAAGGGAYWSIASWYVVSSGPSFHTNAVPVDVDEVLLGKITLTNRQGAFFSYNCQFSGYPQTELNIVNYPELSCCFEALEAYSMTQCPNYPASPSTRFFFIQVDYGNVGHPLNWVTRASVTDCGQHVVVVDPSPVKGEVEIFYR